VIRKKIVWQISCSFWLFVLVGPPALSLSQLNNLDPAALSFSDEFEHTLLQVLSWSLICLAVLSFRSYFLPRYPAIDAHPRIIRSPRALFGPATYPRFRTPVSFTSAELTEAVSEFDFPIWSRG
jgi:hypothetical protein